MPQTMTIREPVLNVHPNVRNGPILGHTLELVVPARVSGGLFARRVDSPAFSWWETITFWDLVNGSWIQRGASTGPVDQALGANNTADFWRNRFSNAVDDPNWNSTWLKTLEGKIAILHFKDQKEFGNIKNQPVVFGTGALDMKGLLAELDRQGFDGYFLIEHEANYGKNLPEVVKCAEYLKTH